MFLPSYRYTPAVTEALAELERLQAKIARLAPEPEGLAAAGRAALARRAAGAVALDGLGAPPTEAVRAVAGAPADLPVGTVRALRNYAFALEQIAGDWPAERDLAGLPVLAGLHFFLTQDAERRGPLPGLRRETAALCDPRDGRPLALTPPPAAVRPALLELMAWLQASRRAVAPALVAGLACLRLLQIQPQPEANGRTACAYTALLLHRAGLLPHGLPAVEAGLAAGLDRYCAALEAASAPGDGPVPPATPWLEYFLEVLREELRAAATALAALDPSAEAAAPVRLNPRQRRMLDLLAPAGATLANQECQELFAVSPVTAARDFRELVALGLVEMHGQGRATFYVRAHRVDPA